MTEYAKNYMKAQAEKANSKQKTKKDDFAKDIETMKKQVDKHTKELAKKKNKAVDDGQTLDQLKQILFQISDEIDSIWGGNLRYVHDFNTKAVIKDVHQRILHLNKDTPAARKKCRKTISDARHMLITSGKKAKALQKQALEEDNKRAIAEGKAANAIKQGKELPEKELMTLAEQPPAGDKPNPYRPFWIEYVTVTHGHSTTGKYKINADKLASMIVRNEHLRRETNDGKSVGYVRYLAEKGEWRTTDEKGLTHLIQQYIKHPAYYSAKSKYLDEYRAAQQSQSAAEMKAVKEAILEETKEQPQYALDLSSAPIIRDTLTMLIAEMNEMDMNKFSDMPHYIVHCPSVDIDVLTLKALPFKASNHFSCGMTLDPDKKALDKYRKLLTEKSNMSDKEFAKKRASIIKSIAPLTQKWFIQSLGGDKVSAKALEERLGLSMLHSFTDGFFIFLYGKPSTGKSTLFNYFESYFDAKLQLSYNLSTLFGKGSGNNFQRSYGWRKLINITPEIKDTSLNDEGINDLKAGSSNDRITSDVKFKGPLSYNNTLHQILNMNTLPHFSSYLNSIARRADILQWHGIDDFDRAYSMADIRKERSQMLALWLIRAYEMYHRKKKYMAYCGAFVRLTRSKQMIKDYNDWAENNSVIEQWFKQCCVTGKDKKIGINYALTELNNYVARQAAGGGKKYHNDELMAFLSEQTIQDTNGQTIYRSEKTQDFKALNQKSKKRLSGDSYGDDTELKRYRNCYVYIGFTTRDTDDAIKDEQEGQQREQLQKQRKHEIKQAKQAKKRLLLTPAEQNLAHQSWQIVSRVELDSGDYQIYANTQSPVYMSVELCQRLNSTAKKKFFVPVQSQPKDYFLIYEPGLEQAIKNTDFDSLQIPINKKTVYGTTPEEDKKKKSVRLHIVNNRTDNIPF